MPARMQARMQAQAQQGKRRGLVEAAAVPANGYFRRRARVPLFRPVVRSVLACSAATVPPLHDGSVTNKAALAALFAAPASRRVQAGA